MRKNVKAISMLALGGMLLQFGGCLGTLPKNIWTGFGLGLGQIPAQVVYDAFLADLVGGVIGGGDDDGGAEE